MKVLLCSMLGAETDVACPRLRPQPEESTLD